MLVQIMYITAHRRVSLGRKFPRTGFKFEIYTVVPWMCASPQRSALVRIPISPRVQSTTQVVHVESTPERRELSEDGLSLVNHVPKSTFQVVLG